MVSPETTHGKAPRKVFLVQLEESSEHDPGLDGFPIGAIFPDPTGNHWQNRGRVWRVTPQRHTKQAIAVSQARIGKILA
jgi:hypothetical protein